MYLLRCKWVFNDKKNSHLLSFQLWLLIPRRQKWIKLTFNTSCYDLHLFYKKLCCLPDRICRYYLFITITFLFVCTNYVHLPNNIVAETVVALSVKDIFSINITASLQLYIFLCQDGNWHWDFPLAWKRKHIFFF